MSEEKIITPDTEFKVAVAKIPASEAIQGTPGVITEPKASVYPMVEEMTFRAIIQSEAEGYALLKSVQAIVNEFGAGPIIKFIEYAAKNPELVQKAKAYLPFI